MAAYDYRCRTCDEVFEVRRAISDVAGEVRCPRGHASASRVWSAVAVTGSGGGAPPAGGGCCGGGCGCASAG